MSLREEYIPLHNKTTLKVGGKARYYADVADVASLHEHEAFREAHNIPLIILGGGSNVLIPDEGLDALVLRMCIQGREWIEEGNNIYLTCGAGEVFDECVGDAVSRGFWGLENLSGIPGSVGGVPIQNVGAYGVEAQDIVNTVTVFDRATKTTRTLSNSECAFTYRDSIFKRSEGSNFVVTQVTFLLSKNRAPKLTYKDLASLRSESEVCTLQDIRATVLNIRAQKFPDWNVVGTAGSFFKNPVISIEEARELIAKYPDIPTYPASDAQVKISLGWILDHICHVRGFRDGKISLYERQALVLICDEGGTAKEIISFAKLIEEIVFNTTNIHIENEVRFLQT